jgi:putative copper export protein
MFRLVLILHLLGAAIWVGGHLVLLLSVLPKGLRAKDPAIVLAFEERYERVGIPALLIQLVSGLWLANRFVPGIISAFRFDDPLRIIIATKLLLLFATIALGAHARSRIIPDLSAEGLVALAWHIVLINVFGIALLILGALMHTGA